MIRGPRVHTFSFVLKERRESRILGLRFNQYSNSWGERERKDREREGVEGKKGKRGRTIKWSIISRAFSFFTVT